MHLMKFRKYSWLIGLLLLVSITSCKRDEDNLGWDTDILMPLLNSSLDITDIISDSLLQVGADSSLKVVYETHLYDMSVDSLFSFYDTSVTRSYTLDSISLLEQTIDYPVTLGQICSNAGILGAIIVSQNGNSFAIPAISSLSSSVFAIDADTLFQSMELQTGFLDLTIYNGLPIDITNVVFELKNTSNSVVVATGTFPLIATGTTETQTISLAGVTIEGNMEGQILSMSSPGSNGNSVVIDTTDALQTTLSVYDLNPITATAIFPAQNLIDKAQKFKFTFESVQLTKARIKSGGVVMDLYSTLQDSVRFVYKLPSATLNGVPFEITKVLPPAAPGGVSSYNNFFDFSGYELDLTGPNFDTVNTMFNIFQAGVDSTGLMKTLSITDSIYSNIGFQNLRPDYVRGYLGSDTFDIGPSLTTIDLFKSIGGNINLQDVNMSIGIENGIGADARVKIVQLNALNTNTGNSVTLSGSGVSNPFNITRATDQGGQPPVTVTNSTFLLNNSNSNAAAFISNLPDEINYSLRLETNPNGNTSNFNDFIYADKLMEFNLNVEIPLAFIANGLMLTDTFDFEMSDQDLSRIKSGFLYLNADNGFPFEAIIQLYTMNDNGSITDSLLTYNTIAAAPVGPDFKVTEKRKSKLVIPVDQGKIDTFFGTKKMKIVARFNTQPVNTQLKIYSDYTIDFRLAGDFTYLAH